MTGTQKPFCYQATEHSDRIVRLYNQGLTMRDVARRCGTSSKAVWNTLIANGITPDSGTNPPIPPATPEMIALYRQGLGYKAVAAQIPGMSSRTVSRRLKLAGIEPRRGTPRAKMPPATPDMIKAYEDGTSAQAIANGMPGMTRNRVARRLRAAGVQIRPLGSNIRPDRINAPKVARANPAMIKEYKAGASPKELAAMYGGTAATVKTSLANAGVSLRDTGGTRVPHPLDAQKIITQYTEGRSQGWIAHEHSVTIKRIRALLVAYNVPIRRGKLPENRNFRKNKQPHGENQ